MVDDPLMDKEQVAERLNVGVRYVDRLVAERRLPHHRIGRLVRFRQADVDAFLAATRVETDGTS